MFPGFHVIRVPCSQSPMFLGFRILYIVLCFRHKFSGSYGPTPTCPVFSGFYLSVQCFHGPTFICFSPTVCFLELYVPIALFSGLMFACIFTESGFHFSILCPESPMFLGSYVLVDDVFPENNPVISRILVFPGFGFETLLPQNGKELKQPDQFIL